MVSLVRSHVKKKKERPCVGIGREINLKINTGSLKLEQGLQ